MFSLFNFPTTVIHRLDRIIKLLEEILSVGKKIYAILPKKAHSATLRVQGDDGMAEIKVGKTGQAKFTEFDGPNGTGNEVPPVGQVVYESGDPAIATIDATGLVTGVAPGTVVLHATDQGNSISASEAETIVPGGGPAQSATLVVTAL